MLPLVALVLITSRAHQETLPNTMPGRRFSEFIEAFNSKDETRITGLVNHTFSKLAFKLQSKEDWIAKLLAGSKTYAPVSIQSIPFDNESTIVVKLQGKTNLPLGIRLDLDPDQPFGIFEARLGPPDELVAAKKPSRYGDWKDLSTLASEVQTDSKLPGLCLAYAQLGSAPKIAVTGLRNTLNPNGFIGSDDRVMVGSIGEAMTATLIARLVDLKKLDWQQTLSQLLPGMKMQDAYKNITIDQLLHHQSGLPTNVILSEADVNQIDSEDDTPTLIRKAYVSRILGEPPVETSVFQAKSSPVDYSVLGYVAEAHIRQSYEWLMDRFVFQPMKLNTALIAPIGSEDQFGSRNAIDGHLQSDFGYSPTQFVETKLDWMTAPAGTAISCSIGDLLKFAEFHLKGLTGDPEILTEASYQHLHSILGTDPTDKTACGWNVDPAFAGGEPCQSNRGTNGMYYAEMTIWPKTKTVIVAFTNAGTTKQPAPTRQAILAIRDKLTSKD